MNVANKLTVARVILAPLFLVLMLWEFPFHYLAADVVFGLAAFTDWLDGHLARKHKLVTNMGKFLDPLADKMLTTAAFLVLLKLGWLDVWAVMLILTREFMVTSVRLIAAKEGTVIAASFSGKLKTVAQYIAILFTVAALEFSTWRTTVLAGAGWPELAFTVPPYVGTALLWIATLLTVISGMQYVYNGRKFFR
ncbi:MAG: CDP-diacylglycerol--glycerol-3-phosphate 3-phosphatidyltransferase [Acutalibacteraceae bacterium]|jgi:CDP-diacylglycerol--glycerol-3-phosphate 3-phosphatidyltransferase